MREISVKIHDALSYYTFCGAVSDIHVVCIFLKAGLGFSHLVSDDEAFC